MTLQRGRNNVTSACVFTYVSEKTITVTALTVAARIMPQVKLTCTFCSMADAPAMFLLLVALQG